MAKRDPHDVLGVSPGANPATIKAAWRRLARANHPDLTGDDPAASQRATRRMAEINDAYEALTRAEAERRAGIRGPAAGRVATDRFATPGRRPGPPPPRPTRPVTARLDMSATFRPRNATLPRAPGTPRSYLTGHPPLRADRVRRDELRASEPTGPLQRDRIRHFRPPPVPTLEAARAVELDFGKFRGHTLGEVAAFEPSYIDWLARTITRDRDLVAAARVLQQDLDRRGVVRRVRPDVTRGNRSA